jgi:hypothetical protein
VTGLPGESNHQAPHWLVSASILALALATRNTSTF